MNIYKQLKNAYFAKFSFFMDVTPVKSVAAIATTIKNVAQQKNVLYTCFMINWSRSQTIPHKSNCVIKELK